MAALVVSKAGDIWELGEHRLLCGDARIAARDSRSVGPLMIRSRHLHLSCRAPNSGTRLHSRGQAMTMAFSARFSLSHSFLRGC